MSVDTGTTTSSTREGVPGAGEGPAVDPGETAPTPEDGTRDGMFAALGQPNYRIYFAGAFVSNIGTWMQRVAQDWLVLELSGGSGIAVGITTALQFLPMLVLSAFYIMDFFLCGFGDSDAIDTFSYVRIYLTIRYQYTPLNFVNGHMEEKLSSICSGCSGCISMPLVILVRV